jgi:hypothetical protein
VSGEPAPAAGPRLLPGDLSELRDRPPVAETPAAPKRPANPWLETAANALWIPYGSAVVTLGVLIYGIAAQHALSDTDAQIVRALSGPLVGSYVVWAALAVLAGAIPAAHISPRLPGGRALAKRPPAARVVLVLGAPGRLWNLLFVFIFAGPDLLLLGMIGSVLFGVLATLATVLIPRSIKHAVGLAVVAGFVVFIVTLASGTQMTIVFVVLGSALAIPSVGVGNQYFSAVSASGAAIVVTILAVLLVGWLVVAVVAGLIALYLAIRLTPVLIPLLASRLLFRSDVHAAVVGGLSGVGRGPHYDGVGSPAGVILACGLCVVLPGCLSLLSLAGPRPWRRPQSEPKRPSSAPVSPWPRRARAVPRPGGRGRRA